MGKLYGNVNNFRTQKVLVAAKLANKTVELAGESAPADKFPLGATPAYVDGEVALFGAEAIALHLAGCVLKGNCSEITQWVQYSEGTLLPVILGYVLPSVSAAQVDQKVLALYKTELFAQLAQLNKVLVTKTFLVGERLTLADLSVALNLLPAFQYVLDPAARKQIVNVTRYFQTIINQAGVKDVVGEVKLAEQVAQFNDAEFQKISAKLTKTTKTEKKEVTEVVSMEAYLNKEAVVADNFVVQVNENSTRKKRNKKRVKKDSNSPKAVSIQNQIVDLSKKEGKKESKKDEKKEDKKDELDAADEAMAAEPKAKDPLDALPKGTFVMDSFKRCYSNEDTLTKAIPHFWENFDAEHYSIWKAEYKYPEELTLSFMSCNLISGMFQRLEKLKKNAFASVILFGTDNNSSISGIWVWRGQELVFPLSPDWQVDYESYEWTKLDPTAESTKTAVKEYFAWEGDFNGNKFNQGKIFK